MKTFWTGLLLVVLAIVPLAAVRGDYSVTFTPRQIWVNQFNTTSFDPLQPNNQPIITSLSIRNNTPNSTLINMKVEIKWNNTGIIDATYLSKINIPANGDFPILTNRDLITSDASGYFTKTSGGDVDFNAIIDSNPVLRDAVLSGYFPDGNLTIRISVLGNTPPLNWSNADSDMFTITVRNTGVINLVGPGSRIGITPELVTMKPVSFIWNAIGTGFNRTWLTIREFAPNFPPNSGSVETSGNLFYEGEVPTGMNNFASFLPFNDNHFYAWQITTDNFNENLPNLSGPSSRSTRQGTISSVWHVFKYVSDASATQNANVIQVIMSQMGLMPINNTFNAGFLPTGTVIFNNRAYTGQDAIDLVESILEEIRQGQTVQVQVRD